MAYRRGEAQRTAAVKDLRCQWETNRFRCWMHAGVWEAGEKQLCLWHHSCLRTPRGSQTFEEFLRWLNAPRFDVYRRNYETSRGGKACVWVRYEPEDLWLLATGERCDPRPLPYDDHAMDSDIVLWRIREGNSPNKRQLLDFLDGKTDMVPTTQARRGRDGHYGDRVAPGQL